MNKLTFEDWKAKFPYLSDANLRFSYDLARRQHEQGAEQALHLPRQESPFVPALAGLGRTVNPWSNKQPDPPRSLSLAEVRAVYDATAFAMEHFGAAFNAHLTIVWRGLSVYNHRHAASILSRFNKEAAAWLRVGGNAKARQRITKRAVYGGSPHYYAYVHENSRDQGFHTHQLLVVPFDKAAAFERWAELCLTRLAGRQRAEAYAVHLSPRTKRGFCPPRVTDDAAAATAWRMFRYVTKSLISAWAFVEAGGNVTWARDVLKPWPYMEMEPIYTHKVTGVSENIGRKVQAASRFVSKLSAGDYTHLYDGDELKGYRQAKEEERREAELQEVLS